MATFQLGALSPGRPAPLIDGHPAGDATAALDALAPLGADRLRLVESGELFRLQASAGQALVATFGPALLVIGDLAGELEAVRGDRGSYLFSHQTVSDAYGIEVADGATTRHLELGPGETWVLSGRPLPFETPFWAGERDGSPGDYAGEVHQLADGGLPPAGATYHFDEAELAAAGARWMFGFDPGDLGAEDAQAMGRRRWHLVEARKPGADRRTDGV